MGFDRLDQDGCLPLRVAFDAIETSQSSKLAACGGKGGLTLFNWPYVLNPLLWKASLRSKPDGSPLGGEGSQGRIAGSWCGQPRSGHSAPLSARLGLDGRGVPNPILLLWLPHSIVGEINLSELFTL